MTKQHVKRYIMNPLPAHIAIIMDGNGRWAIERGLSRLEGHRKGVEISEDIIMASKNMGIRYLTLYAFSDENWDRPAEEVNALMVLLSRYLVGKRQKMIDNGIAFDVIGDINRLPENLQQEITQSRDMTRHGSKMNLYLALSYGGRAEICRAVNRLLKEGTNGISVEDISSHLDQPSLPDPDLLIRTSGEERISNFLLWQIAYSELYFTPTAWPDFSVAELEKAIDNYRKRERRFGRVMT